TVGRAVWGRPSEKDKRLALVLIQGFAYNKAVESLDSPMGKLTARLVRGKDAFMARPGEGV
ncbi:MAG: RNA polymerase sigma factor, partial [Sphingomonas sp.]|nr:RNA polymerase sigma factor [Sphingomonas sp.]